MSWSRSWSTCSTGFHTGCTNSMQLYREVLALGYTGGYHVVHRYVVTIRKGVAVPARSATPRPRDITSWIMRSQESLSASDVAQLDAVRSACPEIAQACDLAREFTDMLRQRRGHLLRDWIQKAELGGPDAIGIFADSIRQDFHAVTATSPCPTAPASSKATSTGSKRSSARCTAGPHSPYSEPASSCSRSHHGSAVRTADLARLRPEAVADRDVQDLPASVPDRQDP